LENVVIVGLKRCLKQTIIRVNRWDGDGWRKREVKYSLICRIQHLRLCSCKRLMFKAISMRVEVYLNLSIPLPMMLKDKVTIGVSNFSQFRLRQRAYQSGC